MGVSREAAGLPWKRDTTMERGGCHYLRRMVHLLRLGQLVCVRLGQLVSRRVTDENRIERIYGMDPLLRISIILAGARACVASAI